MPRDGIKSIMKDGDYSTVQEHYFNYINEKQEKLKRNLSVEEMEQIYDKFFTGQKYDRNDYEMFK